MFLNQSISAFLHTLRPDRPEGAKDMSVLGSSSRRSRRPKCIEIAQTPFHYRSEHVAQADLPQEFHNLTNQANYLFKCVSISRTYPEGHWQKWEKGRLEEDFCYWHFPLCRCLWTVTERLWTMGCHWLTWLLMIHWFVKIYQDLVRSDMIFWHMWRSAKIYQDLSISTNIGQDTCQDHFTFYTDTDVSVYTFIIQGVFFFFTGTPLKSMETLG